MKKINLIVIMIILLLPNNVIADGKTIQIKSSGPLGAVFLEYRISDKMTFGLDYTEVSLPVDFASQYDSTGSMGARIYWYAKGALCRGAYATMFVDYASFDYDSSTWWVADGSQKVGSGKAPVIGFITGYHWVWGDLTLSVGGGYGYMMKTNIHVTDTLTSAQSMLRVGGRGGIDVDVNFGMSF